MKTYKLLLLLLTISLSISLFSSCTPKTDPADIELKSTWAEQCETASNWPVGTMEKALDEIENTPLEELTETYPYVSFEDCVGAYKRTFFGGADLSSELLLGTPKIKTLEGFNNMFPAEHIKKIDSDHVYAVYRVENEGNSGYCYVLAEKAYNREEGTAFEMWCLTGYSYVNVGDLSRADFAGISVGSSMADVKKTDNTIGETLGTSSTLRGGYCFDVSVHLLKDGILTFYYSAPLDPDSGLFPGEEEMKVAKIEFTEDVTDIGTLKYMKNRDFFAFMSLYGTYLWIVAAVAGAGLLALLAFVLLRRKKKTAAKAK